MLEENQTLRKLLSWVRARTHFETNFATKAKMETHLVGRGSWVFPANACFPAAFLTNAPGLKALAPMDTEVATANVTKSLLAIIMVVE
jgi:hypothetical protein